MALYCFITFPTTYYAIRAEKLLKEHDYTFKMVPVPRKISSSCGTALRCEPEDVESIKEIFDHHDMELEGIHRIEESDLNFKALTRKGKNR